MSVPASSPGVASRRQKRMGPAPFASFEDLSDELESPEDKNTAGSVVRLPGIREDVTPTPSNTPAPIDHRPPEFVYTGISLVGAAALLPPAPATMAASTPTKISLHTPNTPRIDISRASSSSHHDSRDSTPDRELFESHDPASAKLGLGFKEEGALDLRSSTEELDFQDPQDGSKKKGKTRPQSPCLHDESSHHHRKDSQSSELAFLCISGRTSRLSSIGSQGSGQSRLSNASHLSVISGQSGLSRSPSPHKMLLETSFCGTKSPVNVGAVTEQQGTKVEAEDLEKVVLARNHDPTKAVMAEGISISEYKQPPAKPARKIEKSVQSAKSDITIKVDEPNVSTSNNITKIPTKIIKSGVEYIYIPLKGPLPVEASSETQKTHPMKTKVREVKSANSQSRQQTHKQKSAVASKPQSKSATPSPVTVNKHDEPKYIRIKLKPDYMYSREDDSAPSQKPDSLDLTEPNKNISSNLNEIITIQQQKQETPQKLPQEAGISISNTPIASPSKLPRQTFLKDAVGSKTPSPSLSRKSSFASLFRSKETIISPESPTVPSSCRRKNTITGILREAGDSLRDRSRSRSKSRDRDNKSLSAAPSSTESIDSKSKQKSVFSIFKPKKYDSKNKLDQDSTSSSEILPSIEGIAKVEFKFNESSAKGAKKYYETPLEGDSIRIPLHSPTHYEGDHGVLQNLKTSSQDSQETVIEVTSRNTEAIVESIPQELESNTSIKCSKAELSKRQSSTSSENVVFSTKLGSNNDIFSTKLPKDKSVNKPADESAGESVAQTNGVAEPEAELESVPPRIIDEIKKDSLVKSASNRNSIAEDDHCSSESERDSELEFPKNKRDLDLKLALDFAEPERKGLVLQQDSYDDELPYVPTTLPQERSAAIPIVPVKQRSTYEMKTCPIERPRSTTPINPSCLEEYCEEVMGNFNSESVTKTIEKLKISLPRHDSIDKSVKSPRKPGNTTNWAEFAEMGISKTGRRSSLTQEGDTPPPLPPKGVQKEWINFEEIPERRKPPKRIQTLPSRGHIEVPDSLLQDNVVYNYVNPEECKCECHEISAREREKEKETEAVQEDEVPLLEDDVVEEEKAIVVDRIKLDVAASDRRSVVSDSSVDLSTSVEHPEVNGGLDLTLQTPFTSDLGLSSNRSSIVSQDEPQSPDSGSPNAFPKTF